MNCEITECVALAKNGDAKAFTKLFELTRQRAYYTALKLTKNRHDAEDIVQEAYIKVFSHIDTLKNDAYFESWLSKIIANMYRDLVKKRKPELFSAIEGDDDDVPFEESLPTADISDLPAEVTDNREIRRLIMDCVDKLPDEQRACVIMYYFDELSVSEIAEAVDVPAGTVKSRLSTARQTLRRRFEAIEKHDNIKLHMSALPAVLSVFLQMGQQGCKMPTTSVLRVTRHVSQLASGASLAAVLKAVGAGSVARKAVAGAGAVALLAGGSIAARNVIEHTAEPVVTSAVVSEYHPAVTKKSTSGKTRGETKTTTLKSKKELKAYMVQNGDGAVEDEDKNIYIVREEGVCVMNNGEVERLSAHKPRNLLLRDGLYYLYNGRLYKYKKGKLKICMDASGVYVYNVGDSILSVSETRKRAWLLNPSKKRSKRLDINASDIKYMDGALYYRGEDNAIYRATVKDGNLKTKRLTDGDGSNVHTDYYVDDGILYYTDYQLDVNGIIYKTDIKSGDTSSFNAGGGITDFACSDSCLYYATAEGGLYVCDESGEIKLLKTGDYYCAAYSDGNMLWCSKDAERAYFISHGSTRIKEINNGSDIYAFDLVNDTLYCRGDSGIYTVGLKGDANE